MPREVDRSIRRLQRELAGYRPVLPPHLTLAPPVSDSFPLTRLYDAVTCTGPLELTIGPSRAFDDEEPVVYFEVGGPGMPGLAVLSRALGARAGYVLHVTLVRALPRAETARCLAATRDCAWRVRVPAVSVLEMAHDGRSWRWSVLHTLKLGVHASVP